VQVSSAWSPPSGTLGSLVAAAVLRVEALHPHRAALERRADAAPPPPGFAAALAGHSFASPAPADSPPRTLAIIAEIKRRSPSKGHLAPDLHAAERAAGYVAGGAAALSVLTEPERFGGSLDDLRDVAATVPVPVLRKDFIVDALQVYEARACGASAVLLIVRALAPHQLVALMASARSAGIEPLVEVRDERELDRALAAGARVIGVNNRNLETLEVDPGTAARVIPLIPVGVVAIAESGVTERRDAEAAAAIGADAILVGSALSLASDGAAAVRALAGVARSRRAGR
jgi:indole-3-glycerol phosphate synthase